MKRAILPIRRINEGSREAESLIGSMDRLIDQVRERAFRLFEERNGGGGSELEDWLNAERDLGLLPVGEIAETATEVRLRVNVPGFDAKELEVTAEPAAITISGLAVNESAEGETPAVRTWMCFRRYPMPTAISIDSVKATLKHALLEVVAEKATVPSEASAKEEPVAV